METTRPVASVTAGGVVGPALVALGTGAAACYVAIEEPGAGSWFPSCPFYTLTGHWCPGCGLTRAFHAAFHGRFLQAFGYNACWPVIAALVIGAWLAWLMPRLGRRTPRWPAAAPTWSWVAFGVLVVAFTVARNLPISPLSSLAP
mgnify:FL=1